MKQRLLNILFWSVISAAFIGPGTVATAASAGAGFGYALIWALIFSTVACYVLQETSARLTVVSGYNLGQCLKRVFSETYAGIVITWLALFSILLGCAAYEAGNIIGAVAGITLLFSLPERILVLAIGTIAGIILWSGRIEKIAILLGCIVAVMGFCFLGTALLMEHEISGIFSASFIPSVPIGSEILVLGLIGTTVVPYNIFLGSGLRHSQTPTEMKISLAIAIGIGGIISIAVLLVGTAITGRFTFDALAEALELNLGNRASLLLGTGLFAAGISSTLTAALAASVTARSILSNEENAGKWSAGGRYFRTIWIGVLLTGVFFGILGLQPVPVIILAQALNGIILPIIAVILLILINHTGLIPVRHQSGVLYNLLTGAVVFTSIVIGLTNVARALTPVLDIALADEQVILVAAIVLALAISLPVIVKIKNVRRSDMD